MLRKTRVHIDLSELERVALLRHFFITHVAESKLFKTSLRTHGGVRYDATHEKIEVFFHPFPSTPSRARAYQGLKRVVKEAVAYVPELAAESNYIEQVNLLYRHYSALPRELRTQGAPDNRQGGTYDGAAQ